MPRKTLTLLVLALSLLALLPVHAQQSQTLIVFAAASLTDAFEDIATAFEAQHPGVDVLFNFAGSSDLAAQLGNGAPADVFASANNRQMQAVVDLGRISDSPQVFARNRLILAVPDFNPAEIAALDDLARSGIKLVIAADAVPVRDYTNAMLDAMAADPAYGEAYRQAFMANVVSEEPNVRQVAAKVALGEADAGIIYFSDATPDIADQVLIFPIPDAYNTIATYPIAALNDSPNAELAADFVAFVLSDEGQSILTRWNFVRALDAAAEPLTIDGQVLNPLTLTAGDLRGAFAAQTAETTAATYTGAALWDLISAAQPDISGDDARAALSLYVVVSGSSGEQAVFSWGELDPMLGAAQVVLAYEADGAAPGAEAGGPLRLVAADDAGEDRYISSVINISLRSALSAAQ